MAAFDFSAAQAAASIAEGQQASVPIESLLMQINADAVCMVRTQFQHIKAHATGRWAETICRVLGTRTAKRWNFVSFRGRNKGEWRGVVDVIAIRKSTSQPSGELLKRGDLFDIILIQVKGGSARGPSASDCARLRKVAGRYHAKAVVQFQWLKGESSSFSKLGRGSKWNRITPDELFR